MTYKTALEIEVAALRQQLASLEERVRIDAVAEMYIAGKHHVRQGDFFIMSSGDPARLSSVSSEGKWTYYNGSRTTEYSRIPRPDEYERLYTIAEVAEIIAKTMPA